MHFSRIAKWKSLTENAGVNTGVAVKRDERGRLVVPVYSGFFSSLTDNVMCTNAMFEMLKKEVDSSVAPYSPKEEIVLTVFESSSGSDEDVKESVLVGFRRYITFYRKKAVSELRTHLLLFTLMFAVGVLMEFLLYGGGVPVGRPASLGSQYAGYYCLGVCMAVCGIHGV